MGLANLVDESLLTAVPNLNHTIPYHTRPDQTRPNPSIYLPTCLPEVHGS